MALNIELFKKVRERIATIPKSFNQNTFYSSSDASPCGTVACLAGEAIICAAPSIEEGLRSLKRLTDIDVWERSTVPDKAAELLGLEGNYWGGAEGETQIFLPNAAGWPYRFRLQFVTGDEAAAAVAFLDYIIETGKVLK
jgi:hypothetical protein